MISVLGPILTYREMLKSLVQRDLRARYKGSVLGFFWTFLNPLLQLAVYSVVFKFIMRVQVPGYDYTIFLFVGLVPWMSFSASIIMCNSVFVANANLLKKVYFPRIVLPLSAVVSNLVNMLFAMLVLFPVIWIAGASISWFYFYLPLIVLAQCLLMLGVGLLVSSLYVFFRDLEHLLAIFMMIWMYLSPILYSPEFIMNRWYHVFKLNPVFPIINSYRDVLLFHRAPDLMGLGYALMVGALFLVVGYQVYDSLQRSFAEEL